MVHTRPEVALSLRAGTTLHQSRATAGTAAVQASGVHYKVSTKPETGIFTVFPTLPLETIPSGSGAPRVGPLRPAVNTRSSGIRCLTFHILSRPAHPLVLLFWQ